MGTTTPIRGLYKPTHNEVGYDDEVNANFDNLDATADKSYVDSSLSGKQPTLTGTGLARDSGACTELSGDATTSGSNAVTVTKINGGTPAAIATSGKWSDLQNGTASLTLSNGTNGTEFDQTSAAVWKWKNTTTATVSTTNASPSLQLSAQYWNGSGSSEDKWAIGFTMVAGTGGNSLLVFTHTQSGTGSGQGIVQVPKFLVSTGVNPVCMYNPGNVSGLIFQDFTNSGDFILFKTGGAYQQIFRSTAILAWSSSTTLDSSTAPDTGLSRLGVGSLALGNGTANDITGALTMAALTQKNNTAGTNASTNASPLHTFSANYWTGAASAADTWTINHTLTAGTNGVSRLTFTHAGSSGDGQVVIQGGSVTNPGLVGSASLNSGFVINAATYFSSGGAYSLGFTSLGLIFGNAKVCSWSSNVNPAAANADVALSRLGAASLALGNGTASDVSGTLTLATVTQQSPNAAQWINGQASELLTLSTSGATTDTTATLLPANAVIEAVVARVTTTITTATDWKLGDPTTAGRFSAALATLIAGTTQVGLVHVDQTGAAGPRQTAAAKVRVTTTGTPGAGAIRITVFYKQFVPPTS